MTSKQKNVHYLDAWLAQAEQRDQWTTPHAGKRMALFSVHAQQSRDGRVYAFRRVMQITERTTTACGQQILLPDIDIEGGWTSLDATHYPDDLIIALYREHATAEQFHSEFKTDLAIERLPSGKFATNDLIMALSAYSYNVLRWISLIGLMGDISPIRHPAKRRRLKTVMQALMYLAARVGGYIHLQRMQFSKIIQNANQWQKSLFRDVVASFVTHFMIGKQY